MRPFVQASGFAFSRSHLSNGTGRHESSHEEGRHEGFKSYEGKEINEEEGHEGEDRGRFDKELASQEQEGQGGEQGCFREGEEGICLQPPEEMDGGRAEGTKG